MKLSESFPFGCNELDIYKSIRQLSCHVVIKDSFVERISTSLIKFTSASYYIKG